MDITVDPPTDAVEPDVQRGGNGRGLFHSDDQGRYWCVREAQIRFTRLMARSELGPYFYRFSRPGEL